MRKFNNILNKYNLKPHRYQVKGKVTIIDTDNGKYVIKEKNRDANNLIFEYLESRNFNYYPQILSDEDDDYIVTEYIESSMMPDEQKLIDMMDLVSLLHSKTTHYKEVDTADYKKLYEDISNNIDYLYSYYNDLITIVESKVYMSPEEYLLARNISSIFSALNYSKKELEVWYEIVSKKTKQRLVVLHNNLDMGHFIKNKDTYLINWDKSKIDIPVFDLYKLYKRHGLDYNFEECLKRYERNYPLLEEERKLLFILITLPDKIELDNNHYEMTKKVSRLVSYIYKTEQLISPYYSTEAKEK